jgi:hypothetical protein
MILRSLGRLILLVLVLAAATAALSRAASAQHRWLPPDHPPTDEENMRARALYEEGQRLESSAPVQALELFEQSFLLSGAWKPLFAIGLALHDLGRCVESRDAMTQLLDSHHDIEPEYAERAIVLRSECAARIAVMVLEGLPDEPEIVLDREPYLDSGARPLAIDVDAGRHSLEVRWLDADPFVWSGTIEPGRRLPIEVSLRLHETPDEESSLVESPVFWTLLTTGVAAVAAGAVLIVLAVVALEPNSERVIEL